LEGLRISRRYQAINTAIIGFFIVASILAVRFVVDGIEWGSTTTLNVNISIVLAFTVAITLTGVASVIWALRSSRRANRLKQRNERLESQIEGRDRRVNELEGRVQELERDLDRSLELAERGKKKGT
jgi:type VI protein secretion system component VasK